MIKHYLTLSIHHSSTHDLHQSLIPLFSLSTALSTSTFISHSHHLPQLLLRPDQGYLKKELMFLMELTDYSTQIFIKKRKCQYICVPIIKNSIEEMIDKQQEKLKYDLGIHHRQNMRQQINPQMIDNLEISNTPSQNYDKAYKQLYHEELEKSVGLFNQKKHKEQSNKDYDKQADKTQQPNYTGHECNPNQQSSMSYSKFQQSSHSPIELKNFNYRDTKYEDYNELKEGKALDYTYNHYDGGKKFHQSNDRHHQYQMEQSQKMRNTLQGQLRYKEMKNEHNLELKRKQDEAAIEARKRESQLQHMKDQSLKENAKNHNQFILQQMEEEKVKKGRKSLFNYDNYTRHNPITNPIERRIDNPYILKQIQNRSVSQTQNP